MELGLDNVSSDEMIPQYVPNNQVIDCGLSLFEETPCLDRPTLPGKRIRISTKNPGSQTIYGAEPQDQNVASAVLQSPAEPTLSESAVSQSPAPHIEQPAVSQSPAQAVSSDISEFPPLSRSPSQSRAKGSK